MRAGRPNETSGNEIAVVVSPRERLRRDGSPKVVPENSRIYSDSIPHLRRAGFSFDLLSLEDYLACESKYPTVLFLNLFYLTHDERMALKMRIAKDAVTPIWFVAPGSVTSAGFSDAAMSDLVGIVLVGAGTRPMVQPIDPAVEKVCGGSAYRKATTDGCVIFVPSAPSSPAAYAELFRAAGARASVCPGPYFRRHGDVFMLHVGETGRYEILPTDRDRGRMVTELFSGICSRVDDLKIVADGPGTWLFRVESAGRVASH